MSDNHMYLGIPSMADSKAVDLTFRRRFVLACSVVGLLGFVGNGLLLCFYGNRHTRTYRSRDAIYIRRIAYSDLLVCALVLPYAVFFENGFVRNDTSCKSLEFIRHLIIYMSHLLLISYSWELPQRHLYSNSQTYSTNTLLFSLLVSLLGSTPTIFIFRAARGEEESSKPQSRGQLKENGGVPPSQPVCQLSPNLLSGLEVFDLKHSMFLLYLVVPAMLYTACVFLHVCHMIQYVDLKHKNSMFVSNLVKVHVFGKKDNRGQARISPDPDTADGEEGQKTEDKGKQAHRELLVSYGFVETSGWDEEKELVPTYRVAYGEQSKLNAGHQSVAYGEQSKLNPGHQSEFETRVTSSWNFSHNVNSSGENKYRSESKRDISFDDNKPWSQNTKLQQRRPTKIPSTLKKPVTEDSQSYEETSIEADSPGSHDMKEEQASETSKSSKPYRPILRRHSKTKRHYPKVGSYKKSMASLILFDLILIPCALTLYFIMGSDSAFLNLVHLKSVVTFYALSIFNPYLRRCVFGDGPGLCLPQPRLNRSGSYRMSGHYPDVQVQIVRERFEARKQEHLKTSRQYSETRHVQAVTVDSETELD